MEYRSNNPYENKKISAADIPGNFINGYTLAFFDKTEEQSANLSAHALKTMIVDTLNLLKGNVEELKETVETFGSKITSITAAQQSLHKEMSKYSIRLNMLENSQPQNKSTSSINTSLSNSTKAEDIAVQQFKEMSSNFSGLGDVPSPSSSWDIPPLEYNENSQINSMEKFRALFNRKKKKAKLNTVLKDKNYKIKRKK